MQYNINLKKTLWAINPNKTAVFFWLRMGKVYVYLEMIKKVKYERNKCLNKKNVMLNHLFKISKSM